MQAMNLQPIISTRGFACVAQNRPASFHGGHDDIGMNTAISEN